MKYDNYLDITEFGFRSRDNRQNSKNLNPITSLESRAVSKAAKL